MAVEKIIKVAIVGPESTGKSSLAKQLAEHYHTIYIPEFAREYCEGLNRNYTLQDEINIFNGQLALERRLLKGVNHNLVFCDTMVLTVKIWCDHLFNSTPADVLAEMKEQFYDLYLLMDIDLPWQEDELRDFPTLREHFMDIWHQELKAISGNYRVISGTGDLRFIRAKKTVDDFLESTTINQL